MALDLPRAVDLLVVGSGPVGSAYVRAVREQLPAATILMVEAGPRLTDPPGINVRNLDPELRAQAQSLSEGRPRNTPPAAGEPAVTARPGTHLLTSLPAGHPLQEDMPAAAMSTNVGGMGAHWTCAVPRPGGAERIGFIAADELDDALAKAEEYLGVTREGFSPTPAGDVVLKRLTDFYAEIITDRPVQPMPLAGRPQGRGRLPRWTGTDVVLGDLDLDTDGSQGFQIAAETLCRRVLMDGDRAIGAELEDLQTGSCTTVSAHVVVVAADALRTPQVLWASGIRLPAVGRYLNDQPQLVSAVYLNSRTDSPDEAGSTAAEWATGDDLRDTLTGVCWVPYTDEHPYHGQIMQMEASPIAIGQADPSEGRLVVGVGYFCAKQGQADDRIEFSDTETDAWGMPAMIIHYRLTEADLADIERGMASLRRAAAVLGDWIPDGEPVLLPAGSSLHYQGSHRMGPVDDGTSVCDSYSRVWGLTNLFVGGNGVIPTATACNPTLTSVALAVRAATAVVEQLKSAEMATAERVMS